MTGSSVTGVVHVGISLLLMIAFGVVLALFGIFDRRGLMYLNRVRGCLWQLVFYVGIPCLVWFGISQRDFVELDWTFAGVFFILRAFVMLLALGWLFVRRAIQPDDSLPHRDPVGQYLVDLVGSSWMNTIIFGIPIVEAKYGRQFMVYNVLAALSSFLFQLPVQLFLFEWREGSKKGHPEASVSEIMTCDDDLEAAIGREQSSRTTSMAANSCGATPEQSSDGAAREHPPHEDHALESPGGCETERPNSRPQRLEVPSPMNAGTTPSSEGQNSDSGGETSPDENDAMESPEAGVDAARESSATRRDGLEATPHEDWSVEETRQADAPAVVTERQSSPHDSVAAVEDPHEASAWTMCTTCALYLRGRPRLRILVRILLNPVFLGVLLGILTSIIRKEEGHDFKEDSLPKWLEFFLETMGAIVTPVAAFNVGVFAYSYREYIIHAPWWTIAGHLGFKLFLLPVLAVVPCLMLGIAGAPAEIAIIVASLPVALASFTLSKQYQVGEEVMAGNIVIGTVLMVPVSVLWSWAVGTGDLGI